MRTLIYLALACVSAAWANGVAAQDSPQPPAPRASAGFIYFAEKMDQNGEPDGKRCKLEIKTGKYPMKPEDCRNDEVSYYRLDNVPSGTLISFDSEEDCNSTIGSGDWNFILRTFGTATTTWKKISDLKHLPPEFIISDWVWVEISIWDHGNIDGKLSCVQIETD